MNKQKKDSYENVVYTCVVGDYDRLYKPLAVNDSIRYIVFTDNEEISAPGWEVRLLEPSHITPPPLINRHCKFFPWKYLPESKNSIYIDGNIRVISNLSRLFELVDNGYDIALLRHPRRNFVSEEIEACAKHLKVGNLEDLEAEFKVLNARGFVDRGRLTENNVIVRSHRSIELRNSMESWWKFVQRYSGRDQISLHYCLESEKVASLILPFNVREPNPFFDIYPHFGHLRTWYEKLYAHSSARKREGAFMEFRYRVVRKLIRSLSSQARV